MTISVRGSFLEADYPVTGSILHAGSHALAVVSALIGMWAGQILRRAVSSATFRRWFLIMLALLGAEMLLRGMA